MSGDLESLHICGNILSTKNYCSFAFRCSDCGDSFDQWLPFIKHLELKHSGGHNDSLKNSVKCEFADEELIEEDNMKIKFESVWEGENLQEFNSNDEMEIDCPESDFQEDTKKSAAATTNQPDKSSKSNDAEQLKTNNNWHSSQNAVEDPELAKILTRKPNGRFQRMRFHVPSNKLVIDLIKLWRENPILWNTTHDHETINNRKRIIESWVNIFKERHNVTFTREDLNTNLLLLRRHYNMLNTDEPMTEAAKYIHKACSFLPEPQKGGRIKCDQCNSFFLTEINYKAHLYFKHQIGECPFKCIECKKIFPSSHKLGLHTRSEHSKQFDFACRHCDKRFLRKTDLTVHMREHAEVKTLICAMCGKGFRRSDHLKTHEIRIHLRQRDFSCTMCPKTFYTKQLLKDHVNVHLNVRDFKCSLCDKAFHSANARMRHKQIHSEVKRYACKLCDAKFHQFVGLNSHLKNSHSAK